MDRHVDMNELIDIKINKNYSIPHRPCGILQIRIPPYSRKGSPMAKQPRAYKRADRKQQVLKQLSIWRENGYATEATSYKLAKALDMRSSQHLLSILNEMVDEGDLVRELRDQSGRMPTFFFALNTERTLSRVMSRCQIAIKKRGVVSAQLEIWS